MIRITTLLLLYFISFTSFAQSFDTILHTTNDYSSLKYSISQGEETLYEVIESDIEIENGDTIKSTLKTDTFAIKQVNEDSIYIYFEYKLSKQKLAFILLRGQCEDAWLDSLKRPIIQIGYHKNLKEVEFLNCEAIAPLLKKGLEKRILCIEKSDDQSMKKYILKYLDQVEDCLFQRNFLIRDLSHVFSNMNLLTPNNETFIRYSIIDTEDSLGIYSQNLISSRTTNSAGNTELNFSEDLSTEASNQGKLSNAFYDIFKDQLTKEEQVRDSIRLNSQEDSDFSIFELSKTHDFLKYERQMNSSMLNIDLKPKSSFYKYTIRRI